VEAQQLPVPDRFLLELERHLFLVYTGKTRLARDLLQNVLRLLFSLTMFLLDLSTISFLPSFFLVLIF